MAIAYRFWSKQIPCFYVESVKGPVGDWGYTTDYRKAIDLSPYWQRRFAADCRYCGAQAQFLETSDAGHPDNVIL